ncbi:carbohydrate ABC transporter permease [Paenibacillus sp. GCM10023252]|uniref:carbohydrate ABC transporter permease n=1 Tax=Paenibacillus sp. GCM10023252 TaxID=3252649 RepID=UPI00360FEAC6
MGRRSWKPELRKRTSERLWAYVFIAPALFILAAFHLVPALTSVYFAFTEWNGLTAPKFIGLDNYRELAEDKEFIQSIRNTLYFASLAIPISITLAAMLAIALNRKIQGLAVYRTMYFIPVVTMTTAIGMIWKWLLHSEYGPVNQVLGWLGLPEPGWLSDPSYAMLSIIIVSVWSTIGYYAIILLAGLQGISPTYYEAADMDGASKSYQLFRITLPLLTPSLFFVVMIALIHALQMFELVFVMTGGSASELNPVLLGSTRTVVFQVYEEGFTMFHMGYASAQAVVLFLAILLLTLVQFKLQNKWVHYQ